MKEFFLQPLYYFFFLTKSKHGKADSQAKHQRAPHGD